MSKRKPNQSTPATLKLLNLWQAGYERTYNSDPPKELTIGIVLSVPERMQQNSISDLRNRARVTRDTLVNALRRYDFLSILGVPGVDVYEVMLTTVVSNSSARSLFPFYNKSFSPNTPEVRVVLLDSDLYRAEHDAISASIALSAVDAAADLARSYEPAKHAELQVASRVAAAYEYLVSDLYQSGKAVWTEGLSLFREKFALTTKLLMEANFSNFDTVLRQVEGLTPSFEGKVSIVIPKIPQKPTSQTPITILN